MNTLAEVPGGMRNAHHVWTSCLWQVVMCLHMMGWRERGGGPLPLAMEHGKGSLLPLRLLVRSQVLPMAWRLTCAEMLYSCPAIPIHEAD